jgi:hypothetical protein
VAVLVAAPGVSSRVSVPPHERRLADSRFAGLPHFPQPWAASIWAFVQHTTKEVEMKALTTKLFERAMAGREAPEEGLKMWRDAAQAQIDEPVIDACIFARPYSYGASTLAGHTGVLGSMLLRKSREIRAGGLPEHFILAVTADKVIALKRTMKAGDPVGQPGPEVARWNRSDLKVTWRDGGYLYKVTLESPSEGEKVESSVGKSPLSESFLELLADASLKQAAA